MKIVATCHMFFTYTNLYYHGRPEKNYPYIKSKRSTERAHIGQRNAHIGLKGHPSRLSRAHMVLNDTIQARTITLCTLKG